MKAPRLRTRIAGSAFVATPMTLAALWSVYASWHDNELWPATGLMLLLAGWSLEANTTMVRYLAWKRAWDGMAPDKPSRPALRWKPWALVAVLAATFCYVAAHRDEPGYSFALGWMVAGLGLLATARFAHWRKRKRVNSGKDDLVCVVVKRPTLPVPSLAEAYRRLPSYCHGLLERGQ